MNETLDQKLATLKLGRIRQVYPSWVEQAAHSELGYTEFLEQLVTEELLARQENQLRRKMKAAGFPYAATIEQFDFSLRPELKRAVLMRFFDSRFLTTASSLLLIGPSGLGKTHLAVALGTKMVPLGDRVRFMVAQQLANAVLIAATRTERARLISSLISCQDFAQNAPPFDFSLKRPGFAVAGARAETPGTHRVLEDVPVVSERVPLPPDLSA